MQSMYDKTSKTETQERKHRWWALMLFFTEMELGRSETPGRWVNTQNVIYTNGTAALEAYANTRCPASQLIDADDEEQLWAEINQMKKNYEDDEWLEKNLYPYM